ncbi:hypothetical protein ZOD2009_14496 [Haladaptatus paucihalophilus DX253]|uniref:Uncharacterized protein n=1 Tax=Haladaptatus paucihalophilus DX253 TaxID=797209 RepID=E7QVR3_HALPU|nr:hypothetical protein [Haladaptatus paucihalophilus]EFW91326.1 hypothetical protein ZOD2009_14496 [Haladaptatus paucihalophilus DX253]SHL10818.1 hypothetical protein SAMN05444342_3049 [Haladaptatus paucihalophilus DX253]
MFRTILSVIGLIELLSPEALIERAERLALDNPDDCELQSWIVPIARVEGLAFVTLVWRSDASYSRLKRFLGVIGVLALMYPHAYVDYGSELVYVDAAECEWKSWVYPWTRIVGLLYVLVAVNEMRKGRSSNARSSE